MTNRIALTAIAVALFAINSGCTTNAINDTDKTSVVATTSILGDVTSLIVSCVDPDAATVTLLPIGADPHEFTPSSEQVARIVTADVVVANGLGLEGGLDAALDNAIADGATVIRIAELVDPIPFSVGHAHSTTDSDMSRESHDPFEPAQQGAQDDDHAGEDDHSDESLDPHFWFDMDRMARAAVIIGSHLAESRANDAYANCGNEVAEKIRATEVDVRAVLTSVPPGKRVLVTDHDALGYLADRYGYTVTGTIIPAGTTLAEPSSADLAALVATIEAAGVPAIFTNVAQSQKLADSIAAEIGEDIRVVPLFVGSLGGPDSEAADYLSLMRTNAERIADALNSDA